MITTLLNWPRVQLYTAAYLSAAVTNERIALPSRQTVELKLPSPSFPGAVDNRIEMIAEASGYDWAVQRTLVEGEIFDVWMADNQNDKTIYVNFKALSNPLVLFNWLRTNVSEACTELLVPNLQEVLGELGGLDVPRSSCYIVQKVTDLWEGQNFGTKLGEIVKKYPTHDLVFTGYSLGATMAEAVALRFVLNELRQLKKEFPAMSEPRLLAVAAPRFIDIGGAHLFKHTFGDRMLTLISSEMKYGKRRWDPVPTYDKRLGHLFDPMVLDVSTGKILQCLPLASDKCLGDTNSEKKALKHHFTLHSGLGALKFLRGLRCAAWTETCAKVSKPSPTKSKGKLHVRRNKKKPANGR